MLMQVILSHVFVEPRRKLKRADAIRRAIIGHDNQTLGRVGACERKFAIKSFLRAESAGYTWDTGGSLPPPDAMVRAALSSQHGWSGTDLIYCWWFWWSR